MMIIKSKYEALITYLGVSFKSTTTQRAAAVFLEQVLVLGEKLRLRLKVARFLLKCTLFIIL